MSTESTNIWSWLIGSPALRLGEAGVEFGFERTLPAWAWAIIALVAVGFGVIGYRRMEGSGAARLGLAALRTLVLIVLAVLISGPRLIRVNETEEKDWVLVLVDRSASMSVADVEGAGGWSNGSRRETRDEELRRALESSRGVFAQLGAERVMVWLGFDGGAYDLTVAEGEAIPDLAEATGRRTDLNRALEQALKRAAARPLAGVVVLSDGRSLEEPSRALVRRLEAERVPVFTVALGSAQGLPDVGVRRVEAPRTAFVKDSVPVQVEVTRSGPAGVEGEKAIVELVDESTGAVLDTREVVWPMIKASEDGKGSDPVEQVERVTLTPQPTGAGASRWPVRVKRVGGAGGAGGAGEGDMVADNNTAEVAIDLVDRPLRIAYFDGYPRWEYRYIKNLLVREASIASVVMLLAPGKRYIQEGTVILDALPRNTEEWGKFDVIVIGDLWPGVMTTEQLEQIKERVSVGGAGLIWIGGEGSTPGAWRSTPMADLLPFVLGEQTVSVSGNGLPVFDGAVTISPTLAAERLGVLRLSDTATNGLFWPPELSDPKSGWSRLYWAQKIDPAIIKPTAEVLATATPVPEGGGDARASDARPIVLSMRFGAGRVLYVGTDEIWRWRYARGEQLPERFWIQMVRLLGRESVARAGRAALIEVAPERAEVDQPVRVAVTLIDQSLVDAAPASLRVKVSRVGGIDQKGGGEPGSDAPSVELTLLPEGRGDTGTRGVGGAKGARTFAATWVPTESGRYRAEAIDPLLVSAMGAGKGDLAAKMEVWQPDDELRRPQADHALLAALSTATKGQALGTGDLGQLPKLLPNRRLKLTGEPEVHTLWDTPLALLVVVLLLTAEWIGRRLMRLA